MQPMWKRKLIAGALAVCALGGTVGIAAEARADEKTWRIGTYLGSAATIYGLAKGNDTLAIVGGGATLLSYLQWKKEVRRRRERDDSMRRYRAYRTSWLRKHRGKRVVRR